MGNAVQEILPHMTYRRELPGSTSNEGKKFQGFELVRDWTDLEFASVSLCVN